MIETSMALQILAAAAALIGALAAMLFAYNNMRTGRYNAELQRAELNLMRKSLESRIYDLTDRLLATEARWRDANHLLISSQQNVSDESLTSRTVVLSNFLRAAGLQKHDLASEPDLVFVLTPFHPDYDDTFNVINNACREVGLRCMRGDEEFVRGDIFSHILRLIIRARIIVANIDGRNPNVFYELGLAHAMDKVTILVSKSPSDVPFDIRAKKLVVYRTNSELESKLQAEFARSLVIA